MKWGRESQQNRKQERKVGNSLLNRVSNVVGNLMPNSSWWKDYLIHSLVGEMEETYTFSERISQKVNIWVRLKFAPTLNEKKIFSASLFKGV